jgi:hypothetical protein
MLTRTFICLCYALLMSCATLSSSSAIAADANSFYFQTTSDISITRYTPVAQRTFYMPTAGWVYFQSDGRYFPGAAPIANVRILVDGNTVTNDAVMDWSQSHNPQQHSYKITGASYLSSGNHTAVLVAETLNGRAWNLGSGSNMTVMIYPARSVSTSTLTSDTGQLNFTTYGVKRGTPLPWQAIVTTSINTSNEPVVAIGSARVYRWGHNGDATMAIYGNYAEPPNDQGSWADNDLTDGAENQAPLFTHFLNASPGITSLSLSLGFTEYSYGEDRSDAQENPVLYRVGAGSRIVAMTGGMIVVGGMVLAQDRFNRTNYICAGSSQGWPGCPAVGTEVLIGQRDIVVPAGHNGVVAFSASTRVQGDAADGGGTIFFYLKIDGVQRGSVGVQQLKSPDGISTRTISASYLAAGSGRLTVGTHRVGLYARVDGSFKHLALTRDLPLIWFD